VEQQTSREHQGDLAGRVVVVTGAGRGLGAAHARALARAGARVVVTDLPDQQPEGLARELGPEHAAARLDVTDAASWARVATEVVDRFGRVDGLVNNAGLHRAAPFLDTGLDLFEVQLRVNLFGAVLGMQALVPHMTEGGSVVNIASVAGLKGWPSSSGYCASKFALRGMSRAAALDLADRGIRVNCVLPGAADTAMLSDESRQGNGVVATLPVPRAARPEEVSAVVLFLLGDASSYCTGQDFVVDGGMTA